MDIKLRPIHEESEYDAWVKAIFLGFGGHPTEVAMSLMRPYYEMDRTVAAFEDSEIVGTSAAYSMTLSIPGGALPCAVLDAVAAAATGRRSRRADTPG